jgi:hypothetical protein
MRFDASIQKDRDNLRLVEANIEELYELATTHIEPIRFPSVPAGECEENNLEPTAIALL